MVRFNGRASGLARLEQDLRAVRGYLEPLWAAWGASQGRNVDSEGAGTAAATSIFLARTLGRGWKVAGGTPLAMNYDTFETEVCQAGGFNGARGWAAHEWVTDGRWIVDLTATQHGGRGIQVVEIASPLYRQTLDKTEVDLLVKAAKPLADSWLRAWLGERAQLAMALPPST